MLVDLNSLNQCCKGPGMLRRLENVEDEIKIKVKRDCWLEQSKEVLGIT